MRTTPDAEFGSHILSEAFKGTTIRLSWKACRGTRNPQLCISGSDPGPVVSLGGPARSDFHCTSVERGLLSCQFRERVMEVVLNSMHRHMTGACRDSTGASEAFLYPPETQHCRSSIYLTALASMLTSREALGMSTSHGMVPLRWKKEPGCSGGQFWKGWEPS